MRYALTITAIVLLAISCSDNVCRETPETGTPVEIIVAVDNNASRAIVEGDSFSAGNTYGLFICEHGSYLPHNKGNLNMRATYTATTGKSGTAAWYYNFEGSTFSFSSIYIMANKNGTSADFYAYSPWRSGASTPENIEFTIGDNTCRDQTDPMWAVQNGDSTNKDIMPEYGTTKSVRLLFKHALSCLRFGFRVRNTIAPINLQTIRIRAVEGGIPLYNRFSLNTINGAITTLGDVETFAITQYDTTIDDTLTYIYVPMLICPVDVSTLATDDTTVYEVEFTFDNTHYPSYLLRIPRSAIRHGDGAWGFRQGYEYRFMFTIDNYLHLDGLEIDSEWHDGEGKEIIV